MSAILVRLQARCEDSYTDPRCARIDFARSATVFFEQASSPLWKAAIHHFIPTVVKV